MTPDLYAELSRRNIMALGASAGIGLGLGSISTSALAKAAKLRSQAPDWYRFNVGGAEITVVSDCWQMLGDPSNSFLGAPKGEEGKELTDNFMNLAGCRRIEGGVACDDEAALDARKFGGEVLGDPARRSGGPFPRRLTLGSCHLRDRSFRGSVPCAGSGRGCGADGIGSGPRREQPRRRSFPRNSLCHPAGRRQALAPSAAG
jgi:hypothetical protein